MGLAASRQESSFSNNPKYPLLSHSSDHKLGAMLENLPNPAHQSGNKEHCDLCGFVWEDTDPSKVGVAITSSCGLFCKTLLKLGDEVATREFPQQWSALEYGSHLRDVLLNVRDRIILASVEDTPTPGPMYRDERVDLGLYSPDNVLDLVKELDVASKLFSKTFNTLPEGYEMRELFFPYPVAQNRTILWVSAQVLHECEHHLMDIT